MTILLRGVVLCGLALAPCRASGQGQPDAIPSDLASALVGSDYGPLSSGVPLFVVGRAPDRFPRSLIPRPPTVVVGGMWNGTGGSLVVAYPGRRTNVTPDLERELADSGWRRPEQPTGTPSGFVSSSGFVGSSRSMHLCRGDEAAQIAWSWISGDRTLVRINYWGEGGMGFCAVRRTMSFAPALRIPTLRPPDAAQSNGGGQSSSTDHVDAQARVVTEHLAEDLLSHYGQQLERAGWRGGLGAQGVGVAVRPFAATDSTGTEWRGALTVIVTSPRDRHVSVRMVRPSGR